MSSRNSRVVLLTVLTFLVAGSLAPLAAQIQRAVFTADINGLQQNANHFEYMDDVYFRAQGLAPDGWYYFQVTDPNGGELLSSDSAACRQVEISGGVMYSLASQSGCDPAHVLYTDQGRPRVSLYPYTETPNPGHVYKAWLVPVGCATVGGDGKTLTILNGSCAKTDNFMVKFPCRRNDTSCDFDPFYQIGGVKYYDLEADGVRDLGPTPVDPPVPGFLINVYLGADPTPVPRVTGLDGSWFLDVDGGTAFLACEVLPIGSWRQTGPLVGAVNAGGTATADSNRCWVGTVNAAIVGLDFGNVCLGSGGGLTLGFWSNKNGKDLVGSDDLAALVALNLRNASGDHFDPSSYADFRTWLLSANATNMAYMLSAQLAAMKLNVYNVKVDGTRLIYAPGTTSANLAGFATANAIIAEANTELGLHGLTLAGSPYRAYQEALKNALDNANNNRTFVQPGPCLPVTYTP